MWAYFFGAVRPMKGKGAGLVLPYCDIGSMNQHLAKISLAVDLPFPYRRMLVFADRVPMPC